MSFDFDYEESGRADERPDYVDWAYGLLGEAMS